MQCTVLANRPKVWTDKEGFRVEGFWFRCVSFFFCSSSFSLHFPFSPLDLEIGIEYHRTILLRAKDPKVRCAQVCKAVAGLVLQGIAGSEHWPLDALV